MQYKKFTLTYTSEVIELLNICFPCKKITQKSFLWKHYSPYFQNKSLGMIALDKGVVCAFVCFTPINIAQSNSIKSKYYSCAVQATHPQYRRKGLVTHLTELVEEKLGSNINYIGFSNTEGVKIDQFSKKIGYSILGQLVTSYVLSLPCSSKIKICKIAKVPMNFVAKSGYLHFSKDFAYLQWRYFSNPKSKYQYFQLTYLSKEIGFIICTGTKFRYHIFDVLLHENTPQSNKQAIRSFAGFAFNQGKFITSYSYLDNSFWRHSFPCISFTQKIGVHFTVKSTKNNLLEPNNWLIQSGDIQ